MLEFLIPTILAAETWNKIKKHDEKKRISQSLKDNAEKSREFNKEYRKLYTDAVLEESVKQISDKELMRIFKSLPSYNPKEKWTLLTGEDYILNKFRKRFTMSQYGKLPISESSTHAYFDAVSKRGPWFGDDVFDYPGQMQHELFLEWERQMNENGFPYQLMVDNCLEHDGSCGFMPVYSRGIPAKDYKYRYKNHYYWSSCFEENL